MMKLAQKILFFSAFIFLFGISAFAQAKPSSRILLIPLDDRPPCFQWVVKMGEIGDAEIVAPPRELLGKFTEFGKSDEIIDWVKKQNLKSFDAAVISIDMLAYGGLVAMREYQTDQQTAQNRLAFIREIKKNAPQMKIYAASVIMRLAPTGNVVNESYRANLANWAEISVDPNLRKETAELEKKIPAEALANYKSARVRDLQTNLAAIKLVEDKVIEQLILGQDDAKPKGVHVADRERLIAEVNKLNLQSKIGVQPGADELSMLSLARALGDKYSYQPKIKAIYSSEAIRNQVMPYEDRPLHQTVSFQIESVGAKEVQTEDEADILFYVYASRFEQGRAKSFAEEIQNSFMNSNDGIGFLKRKLKKFIVADVDPKGDVQGADPKFTEELKNRGIFQRVLGYAAWNTAGNTIGTALPHGMMFGLSNARFILKESEYRSPRKVAQVEMVQDRVAKAQTWFLLNRILDDYLFHSEIRPDTNKRLREKNWNVFRLEPEQARITETEITPKIRRIIADTLNRISPLWSGGSGIICENVSDFRFTLPWDRTFESEIDYNLNCRNMVKKQKQDGKTRGVFRVQ
jgi:Protein of unknown function (DUF4127)